MQTHRTPLALLFSLLLAACGSEADDARPLSSGHLQAGIELPAALRRRALRHVEHAAQGGVAPEWIGARLGRVRALARPGAGDAAYYEVEVRGATGEPTGFVVLSSGPHDVPIP